MSTSLCFKLLLTSHCTSIVSAHRLVELVFVQFGYLSVACLSQADITYAIDSICTSWCVRCFISYFIFILRVRLLPEVKIWAFDLCKRQWPWMTLNDQMQIQSPVIKKYLTWVQRSAHVSPTNLLVSVYSIQLRQDPKRLRREGRRGLMLR